MQYNMTNDVDKTEDPSKLINKPHNTDRVSQQKDSAKVIQAQKEKHALKRQNIVEKNNNIAQAKNSKGISRST